MRRPGEALATLVVFLFARTAAACSCAGGIGFLDVARGALVIRGVVESYVQPEGMQHPVAMNVTIRELVAGSYAPKTIRIIGDFGMSCVPYVSNFPLGTEWIFAIHGPVEVSGLGDENFSFPPCAGAWLTVVNGKANGELSMLLGIHEVDLPVLRELIANPASHGELRPMFASVRSSKDAGVAAPKITGSTQLHVPAKCPIEPLTVEVVIGPKCNLLQFVPDRKVDLCASNALYALVHRWCFTSATQNGTPIAVRHKVRVTIVHDSP